MKAAGAILCVVLALAAGYFVFKYEFSSTPGSGASPAQAIDVTGVKSDLLAIGQAERAYLTSKGSYASLDQLHQDGDLPFSSADRRGYHYDVTAEDGTHFKITATPSDPAKKDWPTLGIDETMQIQQQ
ncbi:MAG: hypothetical protein DMG21_04155 [Acidobacteria bacterium]|nr:MAG: hypothetical protein DMG21_04155 [Acidobacteriota bacterium]